MAVRLIFTCLLQVTVANPRALRVSLLSPLNRRVSSNTTFENVLFFMFELLEPPYLSLCTFFSNITNNLFCLLPKAYFSSFQLCLHGDRHCESSLVRTSLDIKLPDMELAR